MKDQASDARSAAAANRPALHTEKAGLLARLARCRLASIAPMMALLLIPISGGIAFAVEQGGWYYFQRSMQNAADTAAIAAATNNSDPGTAYVAEARAAARPYGFVNGENSTTVNAAVTPCPAGIAVGSKCYEAVINTTYPLIFSRVLGFLGNGAGGQQIGARAVAIATGGALEKEICILSLGSTGVSFQSNGGPKPDLEGCSIMSNSGMTCNGHNLGADFGLAAGVNSGCGETGYSNVPPVTDPYSGLASNIPANSCGSYPQLAKVSGNWTVAATNQISGSKAWTGNQPFCGDIQLAGDVTLTGESTIVIYNGRLDLNGHKLSTTSGAAATIVFAGDNNSTYKHYPTSLNGGGTIDIKAPTSGTWSGVAMYTNPALTTNVSFTYSGNDPTWNITGLAYFPKADLTFSGAVNKSATGAACFVLVSYTVLVNGTASIFANNTACDAAGLEGPVANIGLPREKLVL